MTRKEGDNARKVQASSGTETGDAVHNDRAGARADYAAAYEHFVAGRMAQAETICRKILARDPTNAKALHLLGEIAVHSGNAPAAIKLFNRVLVAKPGLATAHYNLGILLLGQGEAEEAANHFEKAIASEPDFAPAYNDLGNALMGQGKLDQAIASFQKSIAVEPSYAEAHNNLGNALIDQGKLEAAVACYQKAIALTPNAAEGHSNLGIALRNQGKLEEAVASYRKALLIKPDFALALANLGNVLHTQGKFDEAEESTRRAVAIQPDFATAHSNLGILLKARGRHEEAEECLNRALDLKPDDTEARYNHATVHKFVPGDPEIEKLKELLGRKGFSEDQRNPLLFALAKAHDDIRLYAEAFSYYSTANEERARQVDFNPSQHRQQIMAIKDVFRERRGFAGKTLGDAEHVQIFVLGMSRSGKTLVESLLSQHQDAYGAGESHEWTKAMEAVLDKYSIPESFPNCMGLLSDDHIREVGEVYMGNLLKVSQNAKVLINTTPGNYRFVGMILQALPMAKILYCHRDPTDHCLFVYFYRYAHGNEHSHDLGHVVSFYADYQDMMAHWRGLYRDSICSVRYEELVRNPAETGARIYEFCGLHYEPGAVRCAFTTDEIGHWKHYEPYLATLRQALGALAR